MTTIVAHPMAWTNERLKYSSNDCIGLKTLWKMLILDNNSAANIASNENYSIIDPIINNKDQANNMSLLKFFAINALELSAPASPVLLQQQNCTIPAGWLQLAGHPESIAPAANGIVRKRISSITDSEAIAYRGISKDPYASKIIPKFLGVREINGESFLELQDLLHGFKDPAVMDIKMGRRTFLESEVTNSSLRTDLYKKMVAVDPSAPTAEEHQHQAITKLRYMLFREQMSSSQSKGFRIEALKMKGSSPITDLKKVKNSEDVYSTISHFLNGRKTISKELIKRLKQIRTYVEKSTFFQTHEIVGSSIFIVYDEDHVGVWLIDFAKTKKLPEHIRVDHRKQWVPGNCEEGLLHGIDELINIFDKAITTQQANAKFSSKKMFIRP